MSKEGQDRISRPPKGNSILRTIVRTSIVLLLALNVFGQSRPEFQIIGRSQLILRGGVFPSSTSAQVDKAQNTVTFSGSNIHVLILAGPESNMFSYKIAGLTNPTLRIPAGVRIRLTVINVDDDMIHNLVISSPVRSFPERPEVPPAAVRTRSLPPRHGKTFSTDKLVIQALRPGRYVYFCSLPGHAKGGMHGPLEVYQGAGLKQRLGAY